MQNGPVAHETAVTRRCSESIVAGRLQLMPSQSTAWSRSSTAMQNDAVAHARPVQGDTMLLTHVCEIAPPSSIAAGLLQLVPSNVSAFSGAVACGGSGLPTAAQNDDETQDTSSSEWVESPLAGADQLPPSNVNALPPVSTAMHDDAVVHATLLR